MEKVIYFINFISNFFLKMKSLILTFYCYIITQYNHLINIKRVNFRNFSSIFSNINYIFWFLIGFINIYFITIILFFIQDILNFCFILLSYIFNFVKKILFFLIYLPFKIIFLKNKKTKKVFYIKDYYNLDEEEIKNILSKEFIKNFYSRDKFSSDDKKFRRDKK
ncbi:hypothetical protein ['Cynodon dactylon' phytoplasma]|uniref:hypothetical protein n=1 Tax='Cynodon dactylon' phytoplasma TaxID=295320 RepID=UPI001265D491|nr:hypothetical protein ['Cynodon dactylon' phytoplasma]KAB8122095.1 hypothetical protein F1741_00965 ['Cynodon dactylon' phytoplasma]